MRGEIFLTEPQQYERIHSQGHSRTSGPVVMKVMPNDLEISRYGITVSRRVGKAVTRNRVKRRIREILRKTVFKPGWDMVFIARTSAAESSFVGLSNNIKSLLIRENMIETRNQLSNNR
jgi:ribonuclease P protein component